MNPHAVSEERLREFAEPYGGIDALNQRMALHKKVAARLNKEWPDLMARYPDHWVAMGHDSLLATALTVEDLLSELCTAGQLRDPFATGFLDASPIPRILSPLG